MIVVIATMTRRVSTKTEWQYQWAGSDKRIQNLSWKISCAPPRVPAYLGLARKGFVCQITWQRIHHVGREILGTLRET